MKIRMRMRIVGMKMMKRAFLLKIDLDPRHFAVMCALLLS